MRERIKKVMKFSGPRMLLYHPFMAVWHVVSSRLEKKKDKKGKPDYDKDKADKAACRL